MYKPQSNLNSRQRWRTLIRTRIGTDHINNCQAWVYSGREVSSNLVDFYPGTVNYTAASPTLASYTFRYSQHAAYADGVYSQGYPG